MSDGGAIFDLDGTLIAFEATYLRAWHRAARETDKPTGPLRSRRSSTKCSFEAPRQWSHPC